MKPAQRALYLAAILFGLSSLLSVCVLIGPAAGLEVRNIQKEGLHDKNALSTAPQSGRYIALVIGINNYSGNLKNLKTPVADAQKIGSVLRDQFGFEIKLLLNNDATRNQIKKTLSEYRRTLTANDSFLIYYAGHGEYDPEKEKTYWLPADAEADNDANWIIAEDITADIRAIPARHILIISDSCYAGGLTREVNPFLSAQTRGLYLEKARERKSRTLMSSGGKEPVADSGSDGHSVFAVALLSGLTEMDQDIFAAADLFQRFIKETVAGRSGQLPQYEVIRDSGHDYGDFVFNRKGAIAEKGNDATFHAKAGKALLDSRKFSEAEVEYRLAVRLDPSSAEYHSNLSRTMFETKNKLAESESEARLAVKLSPDVGWYHVTLGENLLRQGKYDEAAAECKRATMLEPNVAESYGILSAVLGSQNKLDQAEAASRHALELEPDNAKYHHFLAVNLLDQRKYVEAEAEFRQAIKLAPNRSGPHCLLATAMKDQGNNLKEAEKEAREGLRLESTRVGCHRILREVLFVQGRYGEAEAEAVETVRLNPNAVYYGDLGDVFLYEGKYGDAEVAYRQALGLDPNESKTRAFLAASLSEQGKYTDAEAEARQAISIAPDKAISHYELGLALYGQNKLSAAEAEFKETLRLDPTFGHEKILSMGRAAKFLFVIWFFSQH